MLSRQQFDQYHEQGYLVMPDLLSQAVVAEMGRIVDQLCAEASELDKKNEYYDLEPSHRRGAPRVRRLKNPNKQHALFHAIARDPAILDVIEALNGRPGLRLTHPTGKVNIKAAEYGSPVEWHQDWAGYPHTNDDLLSVSIPLDDCEIENGPLLVVPGTHKGKMYDHHVDGVYCSAIDPATIDVDLDRAVAMTGKQGAVMFHHVRLLHGSALNRSQRSRRILFNQYAAVDAWPLMGISELDDFNSHIVRGEPTLEPLMRAAPVRMPLPRAADFDGLYANQERVKNRFFATYGEAATA